MMRTQYFGQFFKASHLVLLEHIVCDILYIEPDPVNVLVLELRDPINWEFPVLSFIRRRGKAELFFKVFLGGYIPFKIIGKIYLQTIFPYGGRDYVDMLVLGIVVAYHHIRLFSIAHMFHIRFGQFKKVGVFQMFAAGKIDSRMYISTFRIVPIAEIAKDPTEKCCVGIGFRIGVLEAQYNAIGLAQYIIHYPLHIIPI
tara:strand:+ start:13199 stop:13795 length:597 start_codon:yes stop_codon:yes gene_type:complete